MLWGGGICVFVLTGLDKVLRNIEGSLTLHPWATMILSPSHSLGVIFSQVFIKIYTHKFVKGSARETSKYHPIKSVFSIALRDSCAVVVHNKYIKFTVKSGITVNMYNKYRYEARSFLSLTSTRRIFSYNSFSTANKNLHYSLICFMYESAQQ